MFRMVERTILGLVRYCIDHARPLTTTGEELDDLL